jgi:hypothetical protein
MEKFNTVNLKGKEYVMVNDRILAFRKLYPTWAIVTELVKFSEGICIVKATVLDEDGNPKASGHAYEKEGSSFINKTSYLENCETSAVGRALGFLGIGIETSIASAEEVANAIKQQKEDKPLPTAQDFSQTLEGLKK